MNQLDGIKTIGSCAGHDPVYGDDYYEGYVAFYVDSISALHYLISALPCCVNSFWNGWAIAPKWIRGTFRNTTADGRPVWLLYFGGDPLSNQRSLLLEAARTLLLTIT